MPVKKSIDNGKRLAGRPKKYDSGLDVAVKRRNITVTDPGWEGLDEIIKNNNLTSRSELVEQIGRDNLKVLSQQQLLNLITEEEIPVLSRLRSLIKKTAYMRSLVTFARLILMRTGISKEIEYSDDELIEDVIVEAITFIALRDYVYPSNFVASALADTRWLVFRTLLIKSKIKLEAIEEASVKKLTGDVNVLLSKEIDRIFDSIYYFSISFPSEYQIYEMRMIESLTWKQIHRLLKIRDNDISEDEIRSKNHQAVGKIREAWHDDKIGIENREDSDKDKLKKEMEDSLLLAQQYYNLINNQEKFSIEQFREWEKFLLKSMRMPKLDLLLPEIHHSWIHGQINSEIDRDIYKNRSADIMDNISEKFEENLRIKLEDLKQKLKFCGNKKKDIQDILMSIIPTEIPEDYFLGDRCIYM